MTTTPPMPSMILQCFDLLDHALLIVNSVNFGLCRDRHEFIPGNSLKRQNVHVDVEYL